MAPSHQTFTLVQDYKTKFYEVSAIFFYTPSLNAQNQNGKRVTNLLLIFSHIIC
jgi:hypothetical protein